MDDALAVIIAEEPSFAIKMCPARLNGVLFALSMVAVMLGGIIAAGH